MADLLKVAGLAGALALCACGDGPAVHGSDGGTVTGTRELGARCVDGSDCVSGLCIAIGDELAVCTEPCGGRDECPDGPTWGCVLPENIDLRVCGCAPDASSEICGDGIDNECNGAVDDCRRCDGVPVGEDDPNHCGECDNRCGAGQSCVAGECVCTSSREVACDGACVDPNADPMNCGACGEVCGGGTECREGGCHCPTTAPDLCDGVCVDLDSSTSQCGECGRTCAAEETCRAGVCECPTFSEELCAGSGCVDLETDEAHCGSCDNACPAPQSCQGGSCECPALRPDLCGSSCVDTATDEASCGGCDVVCASGEVCEGGACGCPSGVYCGTTCMPVRDPANCGGCGVACVAGQACTDTGCECTDSLATFCDGACVRLGSDEANCGSCGTVCPGHLTCQSGSCECPSASATDCGATAGCVSLTTDEAHCGACGASCRPGETCTGGSCGCLYAGEMWCPAANDCIDTEFDSANCGGCGVVCTNGRSCRYGTCRCPTGLTYCESAAACVDAAVDEAHCGACDNVCPTDSECISGACDCDDWLSTACGESCVRLGSDPAHCGTCGNACAAGLACFEGSCLCPAPILGAPIYPELGGVRITYERLPDGRVAFLRPRREASQSHIDLVILNADGTPSAGPFTVFSSPVSATYTGQIYNSDLAWDGTHLGALFTWEPPDGGSFTYFARVAVDGTVATVPVVIDDDREVGGVTCDPVTLRNSALDQISRLFHHPAVGFTAITLDRRTSDAASGGFSVYSRHLGADASMMAPSRRLYQMDTYLAVEPHSQAHQYTDGSIDFFTNGNNQTIVILSLDAWGGPRAPTVHIEQLASNPDQVTGLALGPDGPEALMTNRGSGSRYPTDGDFHYGPAYGSSRAARFEMYPVSRLVTGEAGTVIHHHDGGDLRLQRLERVGPGDWRAIEAALVSSIGRSIPHEFIHTGPSSGLLISTWYESFPVQFLPCP